MEDQDLPPVGVKVSASSRDPATVKGVHHKRNQLQKMEEAWEQGQHVSYKPWFALKTEVEDLARRSDAASWEKPFTGMAFAWVGQLVLS